MKYSPIGLLDLYQRAGGRDYLTDMQSIAARADNSTISEKHPLIQALKKDFLDCDVVFGSDDYALDGKVSYRNFYNGFVAKYVSCYSCEKFENLMVGGH